MVVQKPLRGLRDDPYNVCRRWHGASKVFRLCSISLQSAALV